MSNLSPSPTTTPCEVYVGIDVCKAHLDVHVMPKGVSFRVTNDTTGHRSLKRKIEAYAPKLPKLIVMEATSRYHRAAARYLQTQGLAVAVVNPFRAHQFAALQGRLAKTDRMDAEGLALFGAAGHAVPKALPSVTVQRLQDLATARLSLSKQIVATSNNRKAQTDALICRQQATQVRLLERQEKELLETMRGIVTADANLKARVAILTSVPGVGELTALLLVAGMPELGSCSGPEAASLLGVAPFTRESGPCRHKASIRGGRRLVRRGVYMAALSAAQYNHDLKAFYDRLVAKGKAKKCALVAVMRKLILLLNTLLKENRPWQKLHV